MSKRKRISFGFTVVELLVVLVIISIILSITIPQFNRTSVGARLKTTVYSLTGLIETTKRYALSQRTYAQLVVDSGNQKVVLERKDIDDVDGDDDRDEMVQVDRGIDIPIGITVYLTADDTLTFNPSGGVENPDDDIIVNASSINKQKTITVNSLTGYVHVS